MGLFACLLPRDAVRVHGREADVVERGQVLEQAVKLEDEADFAPQAAQRCPATRCRRRVAGGERDILDGNLSRLERLEPRNRAKDGRLAGARRSHDAGELALSDRKAGATQDFLQAPAEMYVAQFENRVHDVGAFHRRSSRRATAASGRDIVR